MIDSFISVIVDVVGIFKKNLSNSLLPKTKEELISLLESLNGDVTEDKIALQLSYKSLIPRDIEWIKSEGQCLDKLETKISTVPHAGRGAFAQTFIAKGDTIVIAPLLHIMDYTSTFMHPIQYDDEEGDIEKVGDDITGTQLIVNYCFSHDEMSMYLCPQTNAILINHCSTRYNYGGDCEKYNKNEDQSMRGANAEVRWATEWDPSTNVWLNMTIDEIKARVVKGERGLSFEVVATRDIYPGDEVRLE